MNTTPQSNPEQNFLKKWSLMCVVGYAIGVAVGVIVGISIAYYLGDNLEIRQITSNFLANVVMGVVAGAIVSFFQWIVLRDFLSNAKWWIFVGILASSISAVIYRLVIPTVGVSNSYLSLILVVPLIGLFKGYIEWFVLRKDYQNSKGWISIRVLTNIIEAAISLLSLSIRANAGSAIWGNLVILLLEGLFQGYIFGFISGRPLHGIFETKNEVLATQVQ